jgi:hypothetical protein
MLDVWVACFLLRKKPRLKLFGRLPSLCFSPDSSGILLWLLAIAAATKDIADSGYQAGWGLPCVAQKKQRQTGQKYAEILILGLELLLNGGSVGYLAA